MKAIIDHELQKCPGLSIHGEKRSLQSIHNVTMYQEHCTCKDKGQRWVKIRVVQINVCQTCSISNHIEYNTVSN